MVLPRFASSYVGGRMLMIVTFLVYFRGKRRSEDWFWRRYWLLGAFARSRLKASISFVISVSTSVYRHVSTRPPLAGYSWNLLLLNLSRRSKFYYNQTKMSIILHHSLLLNHSQECSCLGTSLLTVIFNCLETFIYIGIQWDVSLFFADSVALMLICISHGIWYNLKSKHAHQ
jgi:hypothetical protein